MNFIPSMGVIDQEIVTQFDYPLSDASKFNLWEKHDLTYVSKGPLDI